MDGRACTPSTPRRPPRGASTLERLAVVVPEIHPLAVLQEDVEVVLRLAEWAYGGLREVDRTVGVRVGSRLLPPGRSRQDHVGEPGCLRQGDVLDHNEEVLL